MINFLKNMDRHILTNIILVSLVLFYFGIPTAIFAFFIILFYGMIGELLGYLFKDNCKE